MAHRTKEQSREYGIEWRARNVARRKEAARLRYLANREAMLEQTREWKRQNPERHKFLSRRAALRANYGIDHEDYDRMFEQQGGGCAICGADSGKRSYLAVDHDAETGEIRGLLCHHCNLFIGQAGHDIDRLISAATYLMRSADVVGSLGASCD